MCGSLGQTDIISVVSDRWFTMDHWSDGVAQEGNVTDSDEKRLPLLYSVDDDPPILFSLFLGIQQFMTTIGAVFSVTLILGQALCFLKDDPALGYLASTIFMVSGISSLLQITLGIRLPVVQGSSCVYLSCILSLLNLWTCPSNVDLYSMGTANRTMEWQSRLQEIQGAVITVGFFQIIIGFSGLFGFLLEHISPLIIAPTISLVGLTMMTEAMRMASGNWYLAITAILVVVMFSQILRNVKTPTVWYGLSKGWHVIWIRGFQLFPILLATYLIYIVCFSLTSSGAVEKTVFPQTTLRANWFYMPYPFQWGWPRFTITAITAIIPAVIVGIVESISNYYACASICGKSPPNLAAVNRGIGIEGVGSLLAGIFGAGPGMGANTENIGTIGLTLVSSRRVAACGSFVLILLSIVGPLGALFSSVPIPILGGLLCVMYAMVTAVGISHLQYVDMGSHRNIFVLGSSIFFGMAVPMWLQNHQTDFFTGYFCLDQLLQIFLSNHIFVAALTAFLLDSSIPGADQKRKMYPWSETGSAESTATRKTYELPRLFSTKQ